MDPTIRPDSTPHGQINPGGPLPPHEVDEHGVQGRTNIAGTGALASSANALPLRRARTFTFNDGANSSITFPNGNRFTGTLHSNGNPQEGTLTYASGGTYVGTFTEDGERKEGTLAYRDGSIFSGKFLGSNRMEGRYERPGYFSFEGTLQKDAGSLLSLVKGKVTFSDGSSFKSTDFQKTPGTYRPTGEEDSIEISMTWDQAREVYEAKNRPESSAFGIQ